MIKPYVSEPVNSVLEKMQEVKRMLGPPLQKAFIIVTRAKWPVLKNQLPQPKPCNDQNPFSGLTPWNSYLEIRVVETVSECQDLQCQLAKRYGIDTKFFIFK